MNKILGVETEGLASEVLDSLRIGDHLRHDRQTLRGILSLALVLVLAILPFRTKRPPLSTVEVTLLLANPVAHGSRLGRAVLEALEGTDVDLVADSRLASALAPTQIMHFPSLSALSFPGFVRIRTVARAIALRRAAAGIDGGMPKISPLYLEALFLMQAIRYQLAWDLVSSHPLAHTWLSDFDRAAYSRPLIWWARRSGHQTATLVHGTPGRAYLPLVAENVLVWGESQRAWFQANAPKCRPHIVGRPDFGARMVPSIPSRLLVVHSMERLTAGERNALSSLRHEAASAGLRVVLRLHPSARPSDLDSTWQEALRDFEIDDSGSNFLESLHSGDVIVGVTSTAIVDAVTVGLPGWTIADESRELPCDLAWLRAEGIGGLVRPDQSITFERLPEGDRLQELGSAIVSACGKEAAALLNRAIKSISLHRQDSSSGASSLKGK